MSIDLGFAIADVAADILLFGETNSSTCVCNCPATFAGIGVQLPSPRRDHASRPMRMISDDAFVTVFVTFWCMRSGRM